METTNLQLSSEQRAEILAHPGEPVRIANETTRKVYLLIEQGAFPELEDEYIRAKLDEARDAIERGEVSVASIAEVMAKASSGRSA